MEALAESIAAIAEVFAFAGFLAFLVERLVEQFIKPGLSLAGVAAATSSQLVAYLALLLGLAASVAFQVDLVSPLATAVGLEPLSQWPGLILSGLVVGGGSHLVHDVWSDRIRS